jgi:hypothetical protein
VRSLVKLIVVIAVAAFIWKEGIPWWSRQHAASSATATSSDDSCITATEAASEAWGNGIGHFANPPYDLAAWDEFRSGVEHRARDAESKCSCAAESCTTAKTALNDLRALANDLDSAIRNGSPPPSDLVQRQEAIDNGVNSARELVKQGK